MLETIFLLIIFCIIFWHCRSFFDKFLSILLLIFMSLILGTLTCGILLMIYYVIFGIFTLKTCLILYVVCVCIIMIKMFGTFIKCLS